jgi:hypothetical protein
LALVTGEAYIRFKTSVSLNAKNKKATPNTAEPISEKPIMPGR